MMVEPDGSTRIVEYYADSVNGFNANVRTIDGPLFYGGAGIDDDLMMMDQKLLEKQRLDLEVQQQLELGQKLELEKLQLEKLQLDKMQTLQQLQLAQQLEMQGKQEMIGLPTAFSYSNKIQHH